MDTNKQREGYLFKIARKVLEWANAEYEDAELADLVMLDLLNIKENSTGRRGLLKYIDEALTEHYEALKVNTAIPEDELEGRSAHDWMLGVDFNDFENAAFECGGIMRLEEIKRMIEKS